MVPFSALSNEKAHIGFKIPNESKTKTNIMKGWK
jgi:hypothetical protein